MFFEKAVLEIFETFLKSHLRQSVYWKLITRLNMNSVTGVFLGISRTIQNIYFKRKPLDIPYFIKEHLWMSAFDEATLKKKLVEVNPPQSWASEQNGITVVAAVMILEIVNDWRSVLQINILKTKVRTLNPNHLPLQEMYVTIIILDWQLPTWRIWLTKTPEKKRLKLSDYLNQI